MPESTSPSRSSYLDRGAKPHHARRNAIVDSKNGAGYVAFDGNLGRLEIDTGGHRSLRDHTRQGRTPRMP